MLFRSASFVFITFFAVVTESLPLFLAAVASALVVTLASFALKPLRKPIPQRARKPKNETFWYRWSRLVQRRPWTSAISATAILLLLGAPLLSIRLGFGDNGNAPESTTVRRAYDMLAEGFGPGFNGPLFITVQGDTASNPAALDEFVSTVKNVDGIAFAQATPASAEIGRAHV